MTKTVKIGIVIVMLAVASVANAKAEWWSSIPADWSVDPNTPFEVSRFYRHMYTDTIYVAAEVRLLGGERVLVIQQLQGTRPCGLLWVAETEQWKIKVSCTIPADTRKHYWAPLMLTP
jgi:hypothetical protein